MTTRFQFECPKRRLFHQQGRLLRLLLAFTVGVAIGIALTCEANAQDAITTATTVQVGLSPQRAATTASRSCLQTSGRWCCSTTPAIRAPLRRVN